MGYDEDPPEAHWSQAQYEKVHAHVRNQIATGALIPGERLPGERGLASQLGVSRATVRQALQLAEEAGLIVKIPARGTFVAEPRIRQDLGRMQTFSLTVRGANLAPTYTAITVDTVRADGELAAALRIGVGAELMQVEAVGTGDGHPLAHYRSLIPAPIAARLPHHADWSNAASYQVIGDALGVTAMTVRQELTASALPGPIAALLAVDEGVPAFRSRSTFIVDEDPVELRIAWYPGSRYEFTIDRTITLEG